MYKFNKNTVLNTILIDQNFPFLNQQNNNKFQQDEKDILDFNKIKSIEPTPMEIKEKKNIQVYKLPVPEINKVSNWSIAESFTFDN